MAYTDSLLAIKAALESKIEEIYASGDIPKEELYRSYAYIKTSLGSSSGGSGGGGDSSAENQLIEIQRLQDIINRLGEVSATPTANTLSARVKEVVDLITSSNVYLQSLDNKTPTVTLGQKLKTGSLPVTLASDQGNIGVNATQSGTWNVNQNGTWTVNQGGTWTVQQGTAPWSFTLTDGTNTASIRNLTTNDALNVAIVDADGNQITSFGGAGGGGSANTEYLDGATDATPNGLLSMWLDSSNTIRAISATKPLPVDIKNTSLTVVDSAAENSLSNIETDIDALNTKIPANPATDRAAANGPFAVRLSDGSAWLTTLPISGTVSVTGVATETTLSALNTKIPSSPATDRTTAAGPFSVRLTDGSSFLSSLPVTQSGTWSVNLGTLNGAATDATLQAVRDRLTNVTADYDTGAGTQNLPLQGLALPSNGGAVAISTSNPLPISDAGGSLTIDDGSGSITVDGSVTANVNQIGGSSLALGQANMAGSIPVVLPTNQSAIPVSQSGAWTVASSQSGTWTIQPGNTANTTPWRTQLSNGTHDNTIRNLTNAKPIDVAIVDSSGNQISSFGGGTQYTDGTTVATPTGTAALGFDGTNVQILSTNGSGHLNIADGGNTITVDGNVTTNITEIGGSAVSLGQTTMSASVPVTIANNQSALSTSATQSGTWTVQPGNTANTTPWRFLLSTGSVDNSIRDLTNSNPIDVAIVDGSGNQITSFGGGTQYADGTASATPTGTVALGFDGSNVQALSTNASGQLAIHDGGNSITVDQSGTWTVQPGNTANTTPWLTRLSDGTNNNTIRNLTNAKPIDVAIVNASGDQLTSFGGGTEYTEGDVDASITGSAILWEDSGNTLTPISVSKPLPVSTREIWSTVTITSLTTSGTGTPYVDFGSIACTSMDIVNTTNIDVEYIRNGTGTAMPIPAGTSRLVQGITNANQISVRRADTSTAQITIYAETYV